MSFALPTLVQSDELNNHLEHPNLRIVDASWHLPKAKRNGLQEFGLEHLPGAVFLDLDEVSDPESELPHTIPTEEYFSKKIGELGIGNDSWVVVYDTTGLFSAARVWWMFRAFGHERVSLLDGGLPKWKAENRPLRMGRSVSKPSQFRAVFNQEMFCDWESVQDRSKDQNSLILDARPSERFAGEVDEPRPGLRSGHIPNSKNVPFMDLLEDSDQRMLSVDQMKDKFEATSFSADK
ncbi:MAG: rhodanese-like domain-containing protein, partial [SAR324 cluster bacterium]|nr:rhodanese-like domain-containing protein [SAR324 cluster bacterium]